MSIVSKSILFLNNSTSFEKELEEIFQELNYQLFPVVSVNEAKQVVEREVPTLVLASIDEKAEGFELVSFVRKHANTEKTPIILMSSAKNAEKRFSQHQNQKEKADQYIKCPLPSEDVVDVVETLIGLPPPPNGRSESQTEVVFETKPEKDLQKDSQGMDVFLDDLQNDLEKLRSQKMELVDELGRTKKNLAQKDREFQQKERELQDAQEEVTSLEKEVKELKEVFHESEEKHKQAQNALRDYYKPRLKESLGSEEKIIKMSQEVAKLKERVESYQFRLENMEKEKKKILDELKEEKQKNEKIRQALGEASKIVS